MLANLEILEACQEIVVEKAFVSDVESNSKIGKCDSLGIKENTLQVQNCQRGQFYLKKLIGS